jgi:dynein heavy chain
LLSKFLREFSQKEADENSWIVFDGPLDSLWVENMNTVLDDSITLCLSNGERIKLNKKIKLIFEVSDLTQTSPASVSRCGVIYFEKGSLSYKFLCDNYITTNYESFISPSQVQYLKQ